MRRLLFAVTLCPVAAVLLAAAGQQNMGPGHHRTVATAAGTAAAPTFSPLAGAVSNPTTVTASTSTSGCGSYIYFDTSSTPTTNQTTYSVTTAVTLYAYVHGCPGYTDSSVASAAYTISVPQSFALEGHNANYCASAASCAVGTGFTPAAGDVVIACAGEQGGNDLNSFTLSGMGSNSVVASPQNPYSGGGNGSQNVGCWYVLAAVNALITPSAGCPSTPNHCNIFYLWARPTNAAAYDTSKGTTGNGTTITFGPVSTAGNNELMFAAAIGRGGMSTSMAGGSPNAWVESNTFSNYYSSFYQLNAAQVTTQSYTVSQGSQYWGAQIVVLK
jgi:hypothetical protein